MANFKLSQAGFEWLRKREAIIPYVYDDGRGARGDPAKDRERGRCLSDWNQFKAYPTIAMGLRIYPKDYDKYSAYLNCNPVPESLLKELIQIPIVEREVDLNKLIGDTPVTQSMFDALFSMMYNTGKGNGSFKKAIAALKQTDPAGKPAPDYTAAQQAIANGPKTSKGKFISSLAERRQLESEMFMKDGLPGAGGVAGGLGSMPITDWVEQNSLVVAAFGAGMLFVSILGGKRAGVLANPRRLLTVSR